MTTEQTPKRPPARDAMLSVRVPTAAMRAAKLRAAKLPTDGRKRSLSGILRTFVLLFGAGQLDAPPALPDEDRRAQKVPRKKKARR